MRGVIVTVLVAQLTGWAPMASAEEADGGVAVIGAPVSAPLAETVSPTDVSVRSAHLLGELSDGGTFEIDVAGGAWWSTGEVMAVGKHNADLRAQNEKLKVAPVATPRWIFGVLGVGLVVGLCAGFYLGWWLHGQVLR